MSQHPTHESDRAAAYRGLILGAIIIAILLVTVSKLTAAHDEANAGKTASVGSPNSVAWALDA
jgi:hypothetical protein